MKRPVVDEPDIDLNKSVELEPCLMPPPKIMHSFMPMPSLELPYYPTTKEDDDDEASFMHILRHNLEVFWCRQMVEIINFSDFKTQHHLPLARIKRIMKSDPEVKMISADTPILFAKACEIFILDLTLKAWLQTEACRRRTLQRYDIALALRLEKYHFLNDVVPSVRHCELRKVDEEGSGSHEQIASPAASLPAVPLLDMNVVATGEKQIDAPFMQGSGYKEPRSSSVADDEALCPRRGV